MHNSLPAKHFLRVAGKFRIWWRKERPWYLCNSSFLEQFDRKMNCYTRDPEPKGRKGYNQSPAVFDKDNIGSNSSSIIITQNSASGPGASTGSDTQGLANDNSLGGGKLQNPPGPEADEMPRQRPDLDARSDPSTKSGMTSMIPGSESGNNASAASSSKAAVPAPDVELGKWNKNSTSTTSKSTLVSDSKSKKTATRTPRAMSKDDGTNTTVEEVGEPLLREHENSSAATLNEFIYDSDSEMYPDSSDRSRLIDDVEGSGRGSSGSSGRRRRSIHRAQSNQALLPRRSNSSSPSFREKLDGFIDKSYRAAIKYAKFVGPGIMVSVAYLDPGNYATAVSAGALYQYKHLFVVLLSNLFAVFLQILCTKLGGVTGLDLAQNCRQHLSRPMCIAIYILAEIAIIATDLAEVVGTAIALNILFSIPLAWGVVLTVLDVLLVLMAYRPNGPVHLVRYFEYLVSALVFVVVVCFAIELAEINPADTGAIWRGFLPSKELVESKGLYLSCGILGATVMPHSLYLGSGLVQPRLREYDHKHGYVRKNSSSGEFTDASESALRESSDSDSSSLDGSDVYRPSIHAIRYAMNFSIAELVISLFTVAIFVNSAILIVAGSTLANSPDAVDADLFSIYAMLTKYLGKVAGVVFALALLFSGQSAGIVCTLAGQIVSEGFLHWSFRPWIRRIITRALAIAPCLFVSLFVGRKGLATVLNASQVVLSLLLPFVSAPLLYFTCNKKIMRVPKRTLNAVQTTADEDSSDLQEYVDMSNSTLTNVIAILIFAFISILNGFMVISMATGDA